MNTLIKTITLVIAVTFCSAFVWDEKKQISPSSPFLRVIKRWDLPVVLKEVSGISSIDSTTIACIQDEVGSIFIYNISTAAIQEEIPFGQPGDYEGITLVNDTIWVLRADGKLFEVSTLSSKKTAVKEYSTSLTAKHNAEGLCYDKDNNRLLVAIKNADPDGKPYKGIYSFDLLSRTMADEPAFKINMRQEVTTGAKKRGFEIMPSGMAIHPQTKDMYITDGRNSMLMILTPSGSIKNVLSLNDKEFHQPEGITFHTGGEMYISNEGAKGGGNILKVETIQE